ncbi:MaoC family dehydratase [Streptomyces endophytica]|uniref:MaoC family dehydratase n=1 Tax=Streptomyces endophytica TaxID=2991496 RepID=A0ABY6P9U8_9ACTN|nr:MaoC family dehydratase [Streptomyces endophytica]UZJ30566.1 MaoC family dehydratase [Streptomyces endophytica]
MTGRATPGPAGPTGPPAPGSGSGSGTDVLRCGPYVLDRARIAGFAAALGDPHPAYTDPVAARALGHPDTLAPPTYLVTLAAHAEDQLLRARPDLPGLDGAVHRAQSLRHARPAHAGDVLHATVRLADVAHLAGRRLLTLDCAFHDADGLWVATTTSTLLCRPLDPTGSEHP